MNSFDVIIIGGGVLGISSAFHLSEKGTSVLLLEKETGVARHASGKNAGMIRHLYRHPQLTEWTERSVKGFPPELKKRHFKKTGSVIIGRSCPGHHQHLFKEESVALDSESFTCVYTEEDGLLDSGSYIEDLRVLCSRNGVSFLFNSKVTEINRISSDSISSGNTSSNWEVLTEKDTYHAPWIVNASGAWLNSVLKTHYSQHSVATQAYARHLFLSTGWKEKPDIAHPYGFYWDECHKWYMRDWNQEKKLISACETIPADPDAFSPDAGIEETISTRILETVPELAKGVRIGSGWHCFRTYTEDQLPIWGEDSNLSGLFWLGGFGGFGMSTSFAATEDAASHILGQSVFSYNDFTPSRVQDKLLTEHLKRHANS